VGSSPRGCTSVCPPTLQEAKPKAGTTRDVGSSRVRTAPRKRTANGSQSQKPKSRRPKFPFARCKMLSFHLPAAVTRRVPIATDESESPRRKPIGSADTIKRARGPGAAETRLHPLAGANLRRALNPMSAAGRQHKGRTTPPGPVAKARTTRVAERRAQIASAHDPLRAAKATRRRST